MPPKKKTSEACAKPLGPRKRTPSAKAKQSKKSKQNKKDYASSEDSADEAPPQSKVLDVDWKDPDLSCQLLTLIMENKAIKQSLYPPCGPNASTTKGGGKPKVNAQWDLCVLLLGHLAKYKDALEACTTPKDRLAYANKIKNRLSAMAKIARAFDDEMGQTGAGIHNSAEIDMSVTNSFTTKWAEISASCPWYFDMRNLIAQRPNLVPTGLGHSGTGVNADVIIPAATAVDDDETAPEEGDDTGSISSVPYDDWEATPEPDSRKRTFSEINSSEDVDVAGSGDDYHPSSPTPSESGAVVQDEEAEEAEATVKPKGKETHRKNAAKPSMSNPAAPASAAAPKPSKKTKIAEFSEIAKSEEKTRQKELELAALRTRQQIRATEVKGRLVEKREDRRREAQQGKREERMLKLKMKEMKMRNAHELQMAARLGPGRDTASTSHAATFHSHSSASGSHYTSSEPPDYSEFDFDTFSNGNAAAGSSTSATPVLDMDLDFSDVRTFANSYASSSS
ncbi:hypothetical protein DFH07DRAFT_998729 [Mycena maculata]|uniref:Uncharacterized protein n=1 Tax=Mycena maculata TaxID=230809 RepID=A0AAD7HUU1_9AGAR|nr:hypothetical protein DFH07DRAFT_998729 [Mycena maculata]